MSNEITYTQYWQEIRDLARQIAAEAMEQCDNDRDCAEEKAQELAHEIIDGHEWVIYTANNLQVLQHSNNSDYFVDNFGEEAAGLILSERGIDGLHNVLAYGAMLGDVSENLESAFDEIEDEIEEEEELDDLDDE